jgi:hypothetical protein
MTMGRVLSAFVLSGLLSLINAVAPSAAAAGDYYSSGYRSYERPYSSNCCYRRVVRYERVDSNDYKRPHYRRHYSTYYGPSDYESSRSVTTNYYDPPDRYRSYPSRSYYSSYDDSYNSRSYTDQSRRRYADGCYLRRYKVYDDGGGWVWGSRTVCD